MKPLPALTILSLALSLAGTTLAQKPADKNPAPAKAAGPKNVTPDEAEKLIASRPDVIVVDVRTPEEYEMGHIAGAKNASFIDTDFDAKMAEFEGKPILVHCAAGSRSTRAVTKIMNSGKYPEIFHLNGGLNAWQEAGKSVVKTPKAPK